METDPEVSDILVSFLCWFLISLIFLHICSGDFRTDSDAN